MSWGLDLPPDLSASGAQSSRGLGMGGLVERDYRSAAAELGGEPIVQTECCTDRYRGRYAHAKLVSRVAKAFSSVLTALFFGLSLALVRSVIDRCRQGLVGLHDLPIAVGTSRGPQDKASHNARHLVCADPALKTSDTEHR